MIVGVSLLSRLNFAVRYSSAASLTTAVDQHGSGGRHSKDDGGRLSCFGQDPPVVEKITAKRGAWFLFSFDGTTNSQGHERKKGHKESVGGLARQSARVSILKPSIHLRCCRCLSYRFRL